MRTRGGHKIQNFADIIFVSSLIRASGPNARPRALASIASFSWRPLETTKHSTDDGFFLCLALAILFAPFVSAPAFEVEGGVTASSLPQREHLSSKRFVPLFPAVSVIVAVGAGGEPFELLKAVVQSGRLSLICSRLLSLRLLLLQSRFPRTTSMRNVGRRNTEPLTPFIFEEILCCRQF